MRQRQHIIETASVKVNKYVRTVAAALSSGELRGVKRGSRTYITERALTRWSKRGLTVAETVTPQELFDLAKQVAHEARNGNAE